MCIKFSAHLFGGKEKKKYRMRLTGHLKVKQPAAQFKYTLSKQWRKFSPHQTGDPYVENERRKNTGSVLVKPKL